MPPKSNVPIRICGSKTRSGCRTCKQRHIKCDERRPICLRCEKGDRQCTYDLIQATSRSPQPTLPFDETADFTTLLMSRSHTFTGFSEQLLGVSSYGPYPAIEIAATRNFAAYLGKDLAGCFSDEVWCNILPRVAQYESSIWHAIVAVGLLDISVRLGQPLDDGNPNVSSAVKHYSQSIRALNERLTPAPGAHCKDVVLLSCILFAVFECLQDHYHSALRHITGGTKLLMEWDNEARLQKQDRAGVYLNHRSLQPVFFALDSQAVQLGAVDFRDTFVLPAMESDFNAAIPFKTTQEAHVALNSIFNRMSRWTGCNDFAGQHCETPGEDLYNMEKRIIEIQLAEWESAFTPLLQESYWEPATHLLIVQKKVVRIFFEKGTAGRSEMEWDSNLAAFEEATECAEAYMDLVMRDWRSRPRGAGSAFDHPSRPTLTVTMDIVLPLFLISAKCRTSSVRKRALRMLKICGRREGVWDSLGCAAVAENIIQLEEEEALEDGHIPEAARIYMLDIRFNEDGRAEIVYKKLLPSSNGSGYEEVVASRFIG